MTDLGFNDCAVWRLLWMALQLILIFWVVGNPALSLSWPVIWVRRSGMVYCGLGMKCKRHCTEESFIARQSYRGCCYATHDRAGLSSTAFKRVSERLPQRLPQLLTLDFICCLPRVTQFNVKMRNRWSLEIKTCINYLLMIVCKYNFDALDAIHQEVVEVERDFIVNKLIRSVEV